MHYTLYKLQIPRQVVLELAERLGMTDAVNLKMCEWVNLMRS